MRPIRHIAILICLAFMVGFYVIEVIILDDPAPSDAALAVCKKHAYFGMLITYATCFWAIVNPRRAA